MEIDFFQQFANYRVAMMAISRFPLSQKIRVKDAKLTRGVVQAAYKEIKELGIKGRLTIIDYLCWVSARCFFTIFYLVLFVIYKNPSLKKNANPIDIFLSSAQLSDEHVAYTRNLIRLWRTYPTLIDDMFNGFMKEITTSEEFNLFQALTDLYKIYLSKESEG